MNTIKRYAVLFLLGFVWLFVFAPLAALKEGIKWVLGKFWGDP